MGPDHRPSIVQNYVFAGDIVCIIYCITIYISRRVYCGIDLGHIPVFVQRQQ